METRLILDTGASDPIFTLAFAREIGMGHEKAADGTDHADAPVTTYVGTSPLRLTIGEHAFTIEEPLFIEGPAPFEGWDIGGFLSPQLLSRDAWTEVDLERGRIRILEGTEAAVVDAVSARHPQLEASGALSRPPSEGDAARLPVALGARDDARLRVLFNTGCRHTELAPASADPEGGRQVVTGHAVSGEAVVGASHTRGATLRLGQVELSLDTFVVREQPESHDGQLCVDVLAETVILLRAASTSNVHWWR